MTPASRAFWIPALAAWALVAGAGVYARALRSHEVPPPAEESG